MTGPRRIASWWSKLEDISFPDTAVRKKVERRAEALAEAGVDTAIQFGFHFRFDFAPHFGALHGYLGHVADALHRNGLRFLDHYSCNVVARPASEEERRRFHDLQRHCVVLYPDREAAASAGYAGFRFDDLRALDVRTGRAAYSWAYQAEMFCHANPDFREMHRAYLERLLAEVPVDGVQVDDMADYGHFAMCGCRHCRERYRRETGLELPPFEDKAFWGDTSGSALNWGDYRNPDFRAWVGMRFGSIAEHFELIRDTLGASRTLMTCCSSSGPNYLNALSMRTDGIARNLDWIMLENNGLNVRSVGWAKSEAAAMLQRSYARDSAACPRKPAIACSYAVFEAGAYLGWAAARFWGVVNWHSTLIQGLSRDTPDMREEADLIGPLNRWEMAWSDYDLSASQDVDEVRLVFDRHCKENGWTDADGQDHWAHVDRWAKALLDRNVGYRMVGVDELSDRVALGSARTPLVLDGCASLSDDEVQSLLAYAHGGGPIWVSHPLGTLDERGFQRPVPLGDLLLDGKVSPGLRWLDPREPRQESLERLIDAGHLHPRILQISGDGGWKARLRLHGGKPVLHLLNRALEATAHPTLREEWGDPEEGGILYGIRSRPKDPQLRFEIDLCGLDTVRWAEPVLQSPELGAPRTFGMQESEGGRLALSLDVRGIDLYAVVSDPYSPTSKEGS
jgi:hypothetical protein